MTSSRIDALRGLLERSPDDSTTRFMLANELYKAGEAAEAASELERYLKEAQDEGAAYRILADAYLQLGKKKEARWALRNGIEAAQAHHHASMVEEYQEKLAELEGKK